jgi:hypothetical protein
MEPGVEQREHAKAGLRGRSASNSRNGAPPPDDRNTGHDPQPTSNLHGAAMEPAIERREHT